MDEGDQADVEDSDQLEDQQAKHKFKGSNKQLATQYGNKFLEFRKTFQNYNGMNNKNNNNNQNTYNIIGPYQNIQHQTQYGNSIFFKQINETFNKKSSLQGISNNKLNYNSLNRNNIYKPQELPYEGNKNQSQTNWYQKFSATSQGNFYYQKQAHQQQVKIQNQNKNYQQNVYKGQQRQRIQNEGMGRKTFYVSEYAEKKQQQQFEQQQNYETYFQKPRALSRQADAHIKIEVHRDETIRNHLQQEQIENMNLIFYDFNGSSAKQQQTNTANNFYNPNGQRQTYYKKIEGDRVPTRERCFRSAQNNIRRRGQPNQSVGSNNKQYEELVNANAMNKNVY